jgi:hypothetical protein
VSLLKPIAQAQPSEIRGVHPDDERNIFCLHYAGCLDHAVAEGWDNWTCRRCPLLHGAGHKPRAKDFAHDRRRGMD